MAADDLVQNFAILGNLLNRGRNERKHKQELEDELARKLVLERFIQGAQMERQRMGDEGEMARWKVREDAENERAKLAREAHRADVEAEIASRLKDREAARWAAVIDNTNERWNKNINESADRELKRQLGEDRLTAEFGEKSVRNQMQRQRLAGQTANAIGFYQDKIGTLPPDELIQGMGYDPNIFRPKTNTVPTGKFTAPVFKARGKNETPQAAPKTPPVESAVPSPNLPPSMNTSTAPQGSAEVGESGVGGALSGEVIGNNKQVGRSLIEYLTGKAIKPQR